MFSKKNLFVVTLLSVFMVACAGKQKTEDSSASASASAASTSEAPLWGSDSDAWGSGYSIEQLRDLGIVKNPLEYKTVYFEYNSSAIDERSTIISAAHAKFLGERRSSAVQTLMQTVGAGSNVLSAVSYGEERPVTLSTDSASWKANRRVQIVY